MLRPDIANFGISQISAAQSVHESFRRIDVVQSDLSLIAVKEMDIFRLRRGLCLPSATATCINAVLGKRLLGETPTDGMLTLGDMYSFILPYHNKVGLTDSKGNEYPKPWYVVTGAGEMYHQAAIAIAEGAGVSAIAIGRFPDLTPLVNFVDKGGKLALSLDNSFVIDHTLGKREDLVRKDDDGTYSIQISGPTGMEMRKFVQGRHVVSLLGTTDAGNLLIHDSFNLPQQQSPHGIFMELPPGEIEHYLIDQKGGTSRAIAFAEKPELLEPLADYKSAVFVPQQLVREISEKIQKQK